MQMCDQSWKLKVEIESGFVIKVVKCSMKQALSLSCVLSARVCVSCSAPARQITRSFPEGSEMHGNGNEKSEAVSCKDT